MPGNWIAYCTITTLSSRQSGVTEAIGKFTSSFRCVTWDKLRLSSKLAQNSDPNGSLVARAMLGRKSHPEEVHGPDFCVTVTRNRLSSIGLGTIDELRVVMVQYLSIVFSS